MNEAQLVMLSRQGDETAFNKLVELYKDKLSRMAHRILRSKTDTEDVVQETFLKVYLNLNRFDENKRFSTWIFHIGKNICLDLLRRRKTPPLPLDQPVLAQSDQALSLHDVIPHASLSPEGEVIERELSSKMAELIDKLPDKYRSVVYQRYVLEMSMEDIGRANNIPVNTVKSRIHRGKDFMKKRWGKTLLIYSLLLFSFF
ncbi:MULTISPECIES: sigma-70 family RNA polymerase sigma factor [Paenibacillus]|uniref:RNA polymerase sigma factor n=1 Tax=Paenibacillus lignilyticus TaxID=1172615 RepID=A0ABS5C9P3_9BACL|nr:sigma-70 family RNA polymerase sigma factor [Paenibacillus sp. BC26]MBP3962658.1 sigma-70 family RNA polymerase sigma factor [Paenibacillus lignilyticus]SFT06965.1 RNA polymerase sigma-70 factor, ECF subfamily [Paenibacillus sp. BC26]